MSDYMFMLENHLSAGQSAVLEAVQQAAAEANLSVFLAGGAMRDMLGSQPVRDLDFTVEGPALKLAKTVAERGGGSIIDSDPHRKTAELLFPGGTRCEISMARTERHPKPGARPVVAPATIYEDLRGRDFTINAIAISLNRASRGLLIDPTNGVSDLNNRELRAITSHSLYDLPVRLLRLVRLKVRMALTVDERTAQQYRNAREAGMEEHIPPRSLYHELRDIAFEANPLDVLKALEEEGLLRLFSPALAGAKLNAPMFQKLAKGKAMIPFGADLSIDHYALSMFCLARLLNAKERAALITTTEMSNEEAAPWQRLETHAKKLEQTLKSAKLQRASQIFDAMQKARGEDILYLYLCSNERLVQDRIKNFFQKYLPTALEMTDAEVSAASGLSPADAKFHKVRHERIAARLDGRIRKPAPPPEPEPPAAQAAGSRMAAPRGPRLR